MVPPSYPIHKKCISENPKLIIDTLVVNPTLNNWTLCTLSSRVLSSPCSLFSKRPWKNWLAKHASSNRSGHDRCRCSLVTCILSTELYVFLEKRRPTKHDSQISCLAQAGCAGCGRVLQPFRMSFYLNQINSRQHRSAFHLPHTAHYELPRLKTDEWAA